LSESEDVKALSQYIIDWKVARGNIIIKVADAEFSELIVRKIPMLIGVEKKTQYGCVVEVVPESEMTEAAMQTYRQLKRMECELASSGIFRKKYRFVPAKGHAELKKRIEDYVIDYSLIEKLNQHKGIMKLVEASRPDEIRVLLVSVDPFTQTPSRHDAVAQFYKHPDRIAWAIILVKYIEQGLRAGSTRVRMFEILKFLSAFLLTFTKSHAERLESQ